MRQVRIRREPLLVASLILLSVATLSASVLVALTGLSRGVVDGPITSLPEVLLAREEVQVRVAPVSQEIETEAANSSEPSPEPGPPVPRKPTKPAPAGAAPALFGALSLSLSAERTVRNPKDVITYIATVRSTGTAAVSGINFTSHIPAEGTWETGDCKGAGLPVYVSYSGETSSLVCISGPNELQGSGDATHQVELTLGRSLSPGGTATIAFSVLADKRVKQVSNHAHVASGSVRADSDTITLKI